MVKRVDNAVYDIIKAVVNNQFQAGFHVYGLDKDGVGYSMDEHNKVWLPRRLCSKPGSEEEDH